MPQISDERLIVGHATFDDAGVFCLSPDLALVQTVDFFPPVVDDPYQFGQVAAANSLSDVYAMGGVPLTALSIVAFPNKELDLSILGEILRGAGDKCKEAACTIVGGHSVSDPEIKFGLSVTGTVHPKKVTANDGARPGDRLFLTKPLGIGPVTTAYRKRAISDEMMNRAIAQMARLNKNGADAMRAIGIVPSGAQGPGVHAATDITGFGLLGHGRNIAAASNVTLVFRAASIPIFDGAAEFARKKMNSGAYKQNQDLLQGLVDVAAGLDDGITRVIYDAETSGGLLISVSADKGDELLRELEARGESETVEIGFVEARGAVLMKVV